VLLALLYALLRLLIELLILRGRPTANRDLELLALRQELLVIRRTARRPGWRMADRLILAALGHKAVGRPPAHRRAHRSHPQQAHAILRLTPACVVRRRRIIGPNLYRGPRSA
jgi:hypothetical protein